MTARLLTLSKTFDVVFDYWMQFVIAGVVLAILSPHRVSH